MSRRFPRRRRGVSRLGGGGVGGSASTPNSIGYASFGFHLSGVKTLLIVTASGDSVMPDAESIRSGRYPWLRPLYIYVNKAPGKPLPPLVAAFLH